nr:2-hydroxyglutaryl-CoA dehydratase [Desulfobacterales bacterium]
MLAAGIDIGSLTSKAVVLNNKNIVGQAIIPTGRGGEAVAEKVMNMAAERAGISLSDIEYIIATGYGRITVSFKNKQVTEITCHGKGAHFLFPQARVIIDIGGQDSKVIRLDDRGNVEDFAMNDKCAAGSGRFLEVMAHALEVDLKEMGRRSLLSKNRAMISNTCTVFAESEVVSRLASGTPIDDIIAGICTSIGERVFSLAKTKIRGETKEGTVVMTGGVAKNIGVLKVLEEKFGHRVMVPEEPQLVGAFGAALIAQENLQSRQM